MIDEDVKRLIVKQEKILKKDDRFYSNGDNKYKEQIKKIHQESKNNKQNTNAHDYNNLKYIAQINNNMNVIQHHQLNNKINMLQYQQLNDKINMFQQHQSSVAQMNDKISMLQNQQMSMLQMSMMHNQPNVNKEQNDIDLTKINNILVECHKKLSEILGGP